MTVATWNKGKRQLQALLVGCMLTAYMCLVSGSVRNPVNGNGFELALFILVARLSKTVEPLDEKMYLYLVETCGNMAYELAVKYAET